MSTGQSVSRWGRGIGSGDEPVEKKNRWKPDEFSWGRYYLGDEEFDENQ